jgi:tetratricopeptide (TPR) repeat protein
MRQLDSSQTTGSPFDSQRWAARSPRFVRHASTLICLVLFATTVRGSDDVPVTFPATSRLHAFYASFSAHLRNSELSLAKRELSEAQDDWPNDFRLWVLQGNLEKRNGNNIRAITAYKRAHQLEPGDAALTLGLSRLLREEGDEQKAAELLRSSIQSGKAEPELFRYYIDQLLQKGNVKDAEITIKKMMVQFHRSESALEIVIQTCRQNNQDKLAVAVTDAFVKDNPTNTYGFGQRGLLRFQAGEFERAEPDTRRAVELSPRNKDWLYLHATVELRLEKYGSAIQFFKRCADVDSKYAPALYMWAYILSACPDDNIRDGKKAVELGTKACELSGWNNYHALDVLAAAFAESGDFTNAVHFATMAEGKCDSDQFVAHIRDRIEQYKRMKPRRERAGLSQ